MSDDSRSSSVHQNWSSVLLTPFTTEEVSTDHSLLDQQEAELKLEKDLFLKDREYRPSTSQPHFLSSIDSLLAFLNYLRQAPEGTYENLYADAEATAALPREVRLVGKGLSFVVQSEKGRHFPGLRSQPASSSQVVAVKIPRIERREIVNFDPEIEPRCLRAIAWECHVLSHPSIRKCKNIIDIYGITWRQAFTGTSGKRRLLPAIVMEFANEGALSAYFSPANFCLSYPTKMKLILDVAKGLEIIHRHGIIHGDLKAENVLICTEASGELVAKLSDFASAIHDFGPERRVRMPGRSPPWDAPEVRHGTILLSALHKTDIYSFGLLAWRIMLEGQTPFDENTEIQRPLGFDEILQAKDRQAKLSLIQNLKDREDDDLLAKIKDSLSVPDLQKHELSKLLDATIRYRDIDRIDSIQKLLGYFEAITETVIKSETTGQDALGDTGSQQTETRHHLKGANNNRSFKDAHEIWQVDQKFLSSAQDSSRASAGVGAQKTYILDVISWARESPIPELVKRQVFEDVSANRIPDDLVDTALFLFTGFGCRQNFSLGLQRMESAARQGDIRARAVLVRLHQACREKLPPDVPVLEWLQEATAAGSRIASDDLRKLDPDRHIKAIEKFRNKWNGLIARRYVNQSVVEDLASFFHIHDQLKFAEAFTKFQTKENESIDDVNYKGWNFLHYASKFGHLAMLEHLLALGCNVDHQNFIGETALLCACRSGRSRAASILLQKGARADIYDKIGSTPLHYLIYMDEEDAENVAGWLLANGADIQAKSLPMSPARDLPRFICEPVLSDTPLHWAVYANRLDVARLLLRLGADPLEPSNLVETSQSYIPGFFPNVAAYNANNEGSSALNQALALAQMEITEECMKYITIDAGKSLKLSSSTAMSGFSMQQMCLHGARYEDNILKAFYFKRAQTSLIETLGEAVLWESEILIEHVLRQGCDVNGIIPIAGLTPLQLSCTRENGSVSLFLLNHGADPKIRGPKSSASYLTLLGMKPLGTYVPELVSTLLKKGETEPDAFLILYQRAVREGWNDIASEILASGVDKTHMEKGLLHEILLQNSEAAIGPLMFLFEPLHPYGRSSPIVKPSLTVFHLLAMIPEDFRDDDLNRRLVKYLLSKVSGAELLDCLNEKASTVIGLAAINGNYNCVAELLRAGADPEKGHISATMWIVDRIVSPQHFGGGLAGIATRRQQREKYDINSAKTLSILLDHEVQPSDDTDNEMDRSRRVFDLIQDYQRYEHVDRVTSQVLSEHLGLQVQVTQKGGRTYLKEDMETLEWRPASMLEVKIAVKYIWQCMVKDWQKSSARVIP